MTAIRLYDLATKVTKTMRIGLVGRSEYSGLGSQTIDFVREMSPDRVLIADLRQVHPDDPGLTLDEKRYANADILVCGVEGFESQLRKFLSGIDVAVGLESFYCDIRPFAREAHVATVLFPNWEVSEPYMLDLDACILATDDEHIYFNGDNAYRIDWPMRNIFTGYDRSQPPKRFIHNTGGRLDRNGTEIVVAAARYLENTPAKLIIHHPFEFPAWDLPESVVVEDQLYLDRRDLYLGDVLVHPVLHTGLSLQILEAASCGMPSIALDFEPTNKYTMVVNRHKPSLWHKTPFGDDITFWYPDVDELGSLMRDLALNKRAVKPPPRPLTWEEFKPQFHAILDKLVKT